VTSFAWHGSSSYSLRLGGVELLVDPHFSRAEQYADWYVPNPHAPAWEAYFRDHRPDYVVITHGHFDHFDLEAVRRLAADTRATFVGSADVTGTIARHFGVAPERLLTFEPGQSRRLAGVAATAHEGVHWFTGEEGRQAAARFEGRPDRWGVMPCGGPMLGFVLEVPEGPTVYCSGDTMLEGVPRLKVDAAIICTGGMVRHPVTREPQKCIADAGDVVTAVEGWLKPRALVPVHWDAPWFVTPFDVEALRARIERGPSGARVLIPPYNTWTDLPRG